uniref:Chloride intracellular channel 3 n=1 Tax=Piliocolobus tephrosceles TaxID=591936 RepID=A0A8C9LRP0_9PRIM
MWGLVCCWPQRPVSCVNHSENSLWGPPHPCNQLLGTEPRAWPVQALIRFQRPSLLQASRLPAALRPSPCPGDQVKGPYWAFGSRADQAGALASLQSRWQWEAGPAQPGGRMPGSAPSPDLPLLPPAAPPTQASEDGESVGHCPSCQRLFMVLLLKGVPFTLTTVDTRRSPDVLKDFAPGSQLPILLYDSDAKTDTLQIEDFLEETLGPPDFPSLAPRYRESNTAGNNVFHKFSAFIKNPVPAQDEGEAGTGGWMPKWEGVLGRVLTSPPAPSPVPAAAARPRQAGQLPARAPGARAGAGAAAARVPPPLPGRRPAHAGRLQPTAQAAHRRRERGGRAGGQARRAGERQVLTAPRDPARRRCARTSARRPSLRSCVASAATWTARCRRRSSNTHVRTAPRSWRPTGPPCTPASAPSRVCHPIKASLSGVRVS